MFEETLKYLGVDWGEARIGLALGDSETKIATPFKTVKNLKDLVEVILQEEINVLVIGKPYSISNFKFQISNEYNNFLKALKNKIRIPIFFIDERLSSKAADALPGGKKDKAGRDEIAAMLILQTYFDKN